MTIASAIVVFTAGGLLWADDPVDQGSDSAPEQSESEGAADQEEEENKGIETVEYRVPEGGYLTDPAIAQEKPRILALNRIFPLWKSIAGDHALPRPWSVGVVSYWQTQNYDLISASIGYGDLPDLDLDIEGSFAFVDAKSVNANGDSCNARCESHWAVGMQFEGRNGWRSGVRDADGPARRRRSVADRG